MFLKSLAAAAALMGAAGLGSATAGTITYTGYSDYGDGITITSPVSVSGGAGRIQLTLSSGKVIDAWCMDVYDDLAGSGTFAVNPFSDSTVAGGLPGVPTTLTHEQIGEMGALVLHGDSIVGGGGTADQSAAIQVAIWTVEYGQDFAYQPINADVTSLVGDYLSNVGTGNAWGVYYGIDALSAGQTLGANQTLLTAAPEASTWAMIGLGFAGLGFVRMRRKPARYALAG